MKNPNIKLVAVVPTLDGGCQYVAVVKNVSNEEYASLLKEQRTNEQKQKEKIFNLEQRCDLMSETIVELKKEIAILKGEDYEESIED